MKTIFIVTMLFPTLVYGQPSTRDYGITDPQAFVIFKNGMCFATTRTWRDTLAYAIHLNDDNIGGNPVATVTSSKTICDESNSQIEQPGSRNVIRPMQW